MPTSDQGRGTHHLFREIERDFEAIARLIERAISQLAVNGTTNADVDNLARAKKAAERGATLARRNPTSNRA